MISNIDEAMERVFIIEPIVSPDYRALHDEAVSLIESASAAYAGAVYQEIREVNPATYIGSGKVEEIRRMLDGLEGITVLFNGELTPSQTLNLSAALDDRKVIDRTTLILDIFAKNAKSAEGKIQVELSQLKYMYPRLKGRGEGLSRLGGGIGSRGPGESKLETDRRLIRQRIKLLSDKLGEIEKRRSLYGERRKKNSAKSIALVGYTNTGKSTLMNLLTGADVLTKNALFATLDPTSRKLDIDGAQFILTDTVGFLRSLPHYLIESFKSTLEAAVYADLALIVCDAMGDYENQLKTTLDTLYSMNFTSPYIIVMNKCENITEDYVFPFGGVMISAKENIGIDKLKAAILEKFNDDFAFLNLFIPYRDLNEYNAVKKYLTERETEYTDDGLSVRATIPAEKLNLFGKYIVNK